MFGEKLGQIVAGWHWMAVGSGAEFEYTAEWLPGKNASREETRSRQQVRQVRACIAGGDDRLARWWFSVPQQPKPHFNLPHIYP